MVEVDPRVEYRDSNPAAVRAGGRHPDTLNLVGEDLFRTEGDRRRWWRSFDGFRRARHQPIRNYGDHLAMALQGFDRRGARKTKRHLPLKQHAKSPARQNKKNLPFNYKKTNS
jgi:hypothetical protein